MAKFAYENDLKYGLPHFNTVMAMRDGEVYIGNFTKNEIVGLSAQWDNLGVKYRTDRRAAYTAEGGGVKRVCGGLFRV